MKRLHIVTAVIELGAGLALMVFPSAVMRLLLGVPLDASAPVLLGRLAGAALFTLGIACWLARGDPAGRAARGLVGALTFYNLAAVAIFLFAGLGVGLAGIALWPAAFSHAALAVWCAVCLLKNPSPAAG